MNEQIRLSEEEVEINNNLYKKRIEYLVKLGEVKLAEITNEKKGGFRSYATTKLLLLCCWVFHPGVIHPG